MSDIPKKPILVPTITEKLLKENEENQKRWANLFVFNNPSIDEHTVRIINDNLQLLQYLIRSRRKISKGEKKADLLQRIHVLRDETAEWLSTVGDFEKAAQTAYTRKEKIRYKSFHKAVLNKDAEWCDCPKWKEENGDILQIAYREFDFFSAIHGRKISMIRCNSCGFRNARELDADLQKLSDFRQSVRLATENMSKADILTKTNENQRSTNLSQILR